MYKYSKCTKSIDFLSIKYLLTNCLIKIHWHLSHIWLFVYFKVSIYTFCKALSENKKNKHIYSTASLNTISSRIYMAKFK